MTNEKRLEILTKLLSKAKDEWDTLTEHWSIDTLALAINNKQDISKLPDTLYYLCVVLSDLYNTISELLIGSMMYEDQPLMSCDNRDLIAFYEHVLTPKIPLLNQLCEWYNIRDNHKFPTLKSIFIEALNNLYDSNRCAHHSKYEETYDAKDFIIRLAQQIASTKYFNPDKWHSNEAQCKAIMMYDVSNVPISMTRRLIEIYHSVIYGNWLSVFVMSRATLEDAISINTSRLNIETTYIDHGRERDMSLKKLINQFKGLPGFSKDTIDHMHFIREYGNKCVHENFRISPEYFRNSDQEAAVECFKYIRLLVDNLFRPLV
jgi:hypothetical protein